MPGRGFLAKEYVGEELRGKIEAALKYILNLGAPIREGVDWADADYLLRKAAAGRFVFMKPA